MWRENTWDFIRDESQHEIETEWVSLKLTYTHSRSTNKLIPENVISLTSEDLNRKAI